MGRATEAQFQLLLSVDREVKSTGLARKVFDADFHQLVMLILHKTMHDLKRRTQRQAKKVGLMLVRINGPYGAIGVRRAHVIKQFDG